MDRYYKMEVPIVFVPLYLGSIFGISGMESDLECGNIAERVYKRMGSGRNVLEPVLKTKGGVWVK